MLLYGVGIFYPEIGQKQCFTVKRLVSMKDFFKKLGLSIVEGDIWVKLSAIIMGIGYIRRGQIIKGILITILEALFFVYLGTFGAQYLSKFSTLGTVQYESVFNVLTMQNEVNDYDNSFMILLFGTITIIMIIAFIFIWLNNLVVVYELMDEDEQGHQINNFAEDIKSLLNDRFHITVLTLPVIGIIVFTVIPLLIMIVVAFTNYDQAHMPPSALFTWVGFENFKKLVSFGSSASFGYAFRKIIVWTFVWALFATFTNYIGGILLAKLINNPRTKLPKLWRTIFMVTIAVPQFVSLLLVRNFFATSGIVNTICYNSGITAALQQIGLVDPTLNYIPFLTNPHWAMAMIILINIWVGVPYQMLIATGVLMNIPADLIEAARIDGASPLQIFTKITMPYMLFITGPTLVTDFVRNINNFNVIYLLTQDVYITTDQSMAVANGKEVDLLVTWLFRLTSEYYNYKMASVIGCVVFIICSIGTLVVFNRLTSEGKEEAFR